MQDLRAAARRTLRERASSGLLRHRVPSDGRVRSPSPQRRLQGLEDDLSDARLSEKLADGAFYRKPQRQRQVALAEEIERQEARLRHLIGGTDEAWRDCSHQ